VNVLLFDVDGVLVDDRGYRAGILATVNYYSRLMGQGDRALAPDAIDFFHAHGYTNEWDICPLAIGALIASAVRQHPELELAYAPLEAFLLQFRSIDAGPIDYREWVAVTRDRPGRPSERALSALTEALSGLSLSDSTRAACQSALAELLTDPYDFAHAQVTRLFQEHVLGSSLFEEVYRIRPRFDLPSLLYDEDRSALSAPARSTLLDLVARAGARMCVYTARPSLPPSDLANWLIDSSQAPIGFSPEAELALQLIDLSETPLIGMGRMQWLAAQVGAKVEYLTKPAPVQALAAILAAVTGHESDSLRAAYRLISEGDSASVPVALWREPADVWVVEDAVLGIHAAMGAADLLRKRGVTTRLHTLGISAGGPKADALAGLCEAVVPGVDQAIDYIAARIGLPSTPTSNLQPPTSSLEPPTSNFQPPASN
jgi:hypothetical protein